MAELNIRLKLKKVRPRVLEATVWSLLTYILIYYLPLILYPSEILPFDYTNTLLDFTIIAIFFAVATSLFSGSILGHGFGIARAITIIAYFFVISGNGIFTVTLPVMEVPVNLTVDITLILLMIISVNLLDIVRNLLQAITLLAKKANDIDLT
jgi:hypothetical protein